MRLKIQLALFTGLSLLMMACQKDAAEPKEITNPLDQELRELLEAQSPTGSLDFYVLPKSDNFSAIPQDPKNVLTPEKIALGQMLYHETGIARTPNEEQGTGTYSCASCHFASAGFQANRHQGIGEGGTGFGLNGESRNREEAYNILNIDVQPIRTPSAMNTAYQIAMLWNGQFGARGINLGTEYAWTVGTPKEINLRGYHGLETQAIAGLSVHRQLEDSSDVSDLADYQSMFDAAFPEWPVPDRYSREPAGLAIAAYERTLLANRAPFQQWLRGSTGAMSPLEKEGAVLFFGKANCSNCHTGPALNSMEFHGLGMKDLNDCEEEVFLTPSEAVENLGRGGFTNRPEDMYHFKVPQLYNLKDSPFYGHGATMRSIREVIAYKNQAVPENEEVPLSQISEEFVPLGLSSEEIDAITAFVERALYDPDLERYVPEQLPSGKCFPNADERSMQDLGCE